ncbi:MAG: hypothetical protein IPL95_15545 [Saprospiraceae bacterium]|nr:hypothetical protein [Saprospiraceae bacterium]
MIGFIKEPKWQSEYEALQDPSSFLPTLEFEGLKWEIPCYMYNETNVVFDSWIGEYCALVIPRYILKDSYHLLKMTKNVQQLQGKSDFHKNCFEIEAQKEQLLVYLRCHRNAKEGKSSNEVGE